LKCCVSLISSAPFVPGVALEEDPQSLNCRIKDYGKAEPIRNT
jgi:hypothetical protein